MGNIPVLSRLLGTYSKYIPNKIYKHFWERGPASKLLNCQLNLLMTKYRDIVSFLSLIELSSLERGTASVGSEGNTLFS